jgi:hypothetical protein
MPDPRYKKKSKNLSGEEESRICKNQWDRYKRARDNGHLEYISMAQKCDAFYRGDQWDQMDIAALDEEGRPALTINTILPTVNTVIGEQSTRRMDINFKPRRNADEETAIVLNKLFKQIGDNNKLDWVESQVFTDGLIQDRGYFDIRMNFSDHIEGEIKITSEDPLDILIDPDAKEWDPKTWTEVFKTRWMTTDEIEEVYGQKKADRLRTIAENGSSFGLDSIEYEESRYGEVSNGLEYREDATSDPEEVGAVRAIRVVERQHRKLMNCEFYVDPESGDMREVPINWSKQKKNKFSKEFGLGIIEKLVRKVKWTVTADKVVLHDGWSPYSDFTIVPYFPYWRRGKPFGMVRNLLSPQEQLNKISSQELHIVNTTANSGWMVESGSLVGMTADDLEEHGAQTGLVLEYNRGSQPPAKIPHNTIPTGLDRIAQKAAFNVKEISGIGDSMLGTDSAEVSGVAIRAKQERGALMIQVPLDNLTKTRQYLAENMLGLIQRFYTEQRVIQVTNEEDPMKPREPMVVNEMTPEGIVINDLTIGEYDVIVGTAPARDNFDDIQFAQALELKQMGVPIPDDVIIEYSNLQRKNELARRIRVQTGQEPPTEEEAKIMQFQAEAQIKQIELQLAQLEAEVGKTQSEAQLNSAKAQDLMEIDPQIQVAKLQAQLQMKREELELRRALSSDTNQMRISQSDTQAAAKMAATVITSK